MNDQFVATFPLLKANELPGADTWNDLILFMRGIKSESPFLTLSNRDPEGCSIQLDVAGILELFRGTVWTFMATLDWDASDNRGKDAPYLSISAGTVRTPLATTEVPAYRERCKKDAATRAWLRITKSSAEIRIGGNEFPAFVDDENGRVNWPLAIVEKTEEDTGSVPAGTADPTAVTPYSITVLHQGDVNITAAPPSWVESYATSGSLARVIVDGKETFAEIGECDEEEE